MRCEEGCVTPKEFQRILRRDNESCYHCATDDQTLIPQHRANRGHGGSKSANKLSNLITFCSIANGLLESDPDFADLGRHNGWKLSRYDDPLKVPVFDVGSGRWWRLDDLGNRWLDPHRN